MPWLQSLAAEFATSMALLFGSVSLLFGIWVPRRVGLLASDAPAGETLGVGLASGLLVLAAWWAALASGGRSSFTPVAVGFAMVIALAVARRARPPADAGSPASASAEIAAETTASRSSRHRNLILAAFAGAAFITAVALLYGSTMALSPRHGAQPLEFTDEAFYSILGADLARAGTETDSTRTRVSADIASPLFQWAPQRKLYATPDAHPSSESVAAFLKDNGIYYIYADAVHPNSLVPDAIPIATSGEAQVLRVP